jgi:uncharacterized protein with HEPN domain
MTKGIRVYLEDILESIEKIDEYTKAVKWREFERNGQMQDAVMRRLEIMGEAVKKIPEAVKKESPDIPWRQISGMRDVLIHDYGEVRLERVWKTVQNDLAPFKAGIQAILRKSGK